MFWKVKEIKNINENRIWNLIGTQYRPNKYSLMDNVVLGDTLNVTTERGIINGIVTSITMRGVGIETNDGYKFLKWYNVISKIV